MRRESLAANMSTGLPRIRAAVHTTTKGSQPDVRRVPGIKGHARRSMETGPGMASGAEANHGPGGPVCPANPAPWRMVCRHVPDDILCAHAQTTEGGIDGEIHPHSLRPAPR